MHRILFVLLSGALLLTLLPGCTSREATSSQTASAPEALSPADPFYGEVLEKLGAKTTEDGLLVATPCSLLTVNWAEPEELAGYRYTHWYMEQLPDLHREEKRDRYAPPKGETGWLIPAEELEQAAAERFGVSADHLRADTDCYREDLGGYQTGGVGLGDRPVLTITAVRSDGDREILTILEEWTVEQRSQTVELTIRRNGADWQAVSCLPENAVTSAGEAEDWLTEAMQLVQIEPSATGRFTDHGLGCPLLSAEPWDDPSELEPHALLDWYLRMGLPITSRDDGVETRIAAADFEGALEQYFTPADPAFLREQADIYDADAGEYHAPLIGGRGMGSAFWAAPLSRDGDRQTVLISGASAGGPRTKGILTLQHRDDGSARLVSWDPDRSTMGLVFNTFNKL